MIGQSTWTDRPRKRGTAINEHLGTTATTLPDLVRELGKRRFGHTPRVGDAFCGGGSVPFEAARLGCKVYGSDLNPVAALLTWGAINIIGGGEQIAERVGEAQADVFEALDRQVTEWRIEHNDAGWRADAFLYCTEITCPECGWHVPLAPNWVIGQKTRTVAKLIPIPTERRFSINIRSGVGPDGLTKAREAGTVKESRLECPNPNCGESTPMAAIRGDRRDADSGEFGLRLWQNDDLVPRPEDVFQERLYCVRWRLPQLDALLWVEQRGRKIDADAAGHESRTSNKNRTQSDSSEESATVPEWVDLTQAIKALGELLGANERRELEKLRNRDWRAEDDALKVAQHELDAIMGAKRPNKEIDAKARQVSKLKAGVTRRNATLEVLAKSLPGTVYRTVDKTDLRREERALGLLQERFEAWQESGHIPSRKIAPGAKTNEPIRTRGWTHWHHLFTPRQLLVHGELAEKSAASEMATESKVACIFGLWKCCDRNSKLCVWDSHPANEKVANTFLNQAFNPLMNFGSRSVPALISAWSLPIRDRRRLDVGTVEPIDAREVTTSCDYWITDPPYADAVNYHELSEILLSWSDSALSGLFSNWYTDSKRALAVQGTGTDFRLSMVDCYRNLVAHMPDNGLQVVMFTHQDASVWADLTLILWAAGLRVTAAWTIATETESAMKQGNYVQGTVLMVLRKQTSEETVFLDELVPEVESEVEQQLKSMLQLDDREDPNFSDADYQLAAYAAALRVLTRYGSIEDINVAYQLARERSAGESNPIGALITNAVRTASNFLVPSGLPGHLWRQLAPEEKLYLKGLEVESHGDFRTGVYQEFARGFGVRDYRFLLQTGKANQTRLRTASEFQRRELGESAFGRSLVRQALYAVWRAAQSGDTAQSLTWLRTEVGDYWAQREALAAVLRYLAQLEIDHWSDDADAARIVAGAVDNDHV